MEILFENLKEQMKINTIVESGKYNRTVVQVLSDNSNLLVAVNFEGISCVHFSYLYFP